MRLLSPAQLDSQLQHWGYSPVGEWATTVDQGSLSVGLHDPRTGTIPHLSPVGDSEPFVHFLVELLSALDPGPLLAMPGRCGQNHHPEDADRPQPTGSSWAGALPKPLRQWGINEQFAGALLIEENDQQQALAALAEYAFVGRCDVSLCCQRVPLVCCLCHEADLHFQSPDLALLQRIRTDALEAGLWPSPPDDWP